MGGRATGRLRASPWRFPWAAGNALPGEQTHLVAKAQHIVSIMRFALTFVEALAALFLPEKWRGVRGRRKLRRSLRLATSQIPMYQELYRGVDPSKDPCREVTHLPLLSPAFLKSQPLSTLKPDSLLDEDLILHGTSGSTGTPFRFYQSRADVFSWYASTLRFFLVSGWRPWWPTAVVWREDLSPPKGLIQRLIEKQKRIISIHWPLDVQAEQLLDYKPRMIYGISSALDVLASWMIENDRVVASADLVVGMGEPISKSMAERFEEAFGHRGLNFYGANECGLMGWECKHCGLFHFEDDSFLFEVMDENLHPVGPGEEGHLLVTTLDRTVLPLIRYDIGDLITLPPEGAQECWVPFRQFAAVSGRVTDRLILKDGREASFHSVYALTAVIEGVERIQFVQGGDAEVIVRYVPKEGFPVEDIERSVTDGLRTLGEVALRFEQLAEIPLEKSGKFKLIKKET